jgi:DNA-binding NarL/FixJ family response regulator
MSNISTNEVSSKRYKMPIKSGEREAYLTRKETVIVALLIKGMRAKQIAWELNSSLHTINTHLSNIKEKLNCDNIFQLGLILGDYKTELERITIYKLR